MRKYNKIFDRGIRDNESRGRYPKRRNEQREDREMFEVICDACGRPCEVPFKPSNDKPIYCSDCFESHRDSERGGERRDKRNNRRDRDNRRDSRRSEDREMFDAVCSKCGAACKLPFRPSSDKPIYCDNCFEGEKKKGGDRYEKQFEILNEKLDKIIEALNILPTAVEEIKVVEEIEVAPEKKKKSTTKKIKKTPSKKKVSKK